MRAHTPSLLLLAVLCGCPASLRSATPEERDAGYAACEERLGEFVRALDAGQSDRAAAMVDEEWARGAGTSPEAHVEGLAQHLRGATIEVGETSWRAGTVSLHVTATVVAPNSQRVTTMTIRFARDDAGEWKIRGYRLHVVNVSSGP